MNTGMLWFVGDKSSKTFEEKIVDAALYYRRKFDRAPELCLVNGDDLRKSLEITGKKSMETITAPDHIVLTVRAWRSVLPNHLWMGVADDPEYAKEIFEQNARQIREVPA